jgi:hypothetical protein
MSKCTIEYHNMYIEYYLKYELDLTYLSHYNKNWLKK